MKDKNKVDKHFVSSIDKFLAEFDRTHPKSSPQKAEIKKYERIYQLRDNPVKEINGETSDLL